MTKLWTSAVVAAAAGLAHAQCHQPVWSNEFATPALGLSDLAVTIQAFDVDGAGPAAPALFVGGYFQTAGGLPIARLAKRAGGQWSSVGTFNGTLVTGLGVHDFDGTGPGGPELIAVGNFTTINGVAIQNAARWNGSQWSAIGNGIPYPYVGFGTSTIVSWDHDGNAATPARLVISGQFEIAEFQYARIMMWDGVQWTIIPGDDALSIAVFDEDGAGPQPEKLFATLDWDPGLQKWDGQTWEVVGGGLRSALHTCVALRVIDEDGPGPGREALFVGGYFSQAGSVATSGVARWNGQAWSAVGTGLATQVEDILAVDYTGGTGSPTIYATGWGANGFVWKYVPSSGQWTVVGTSNSSMGVSFFYRLAAIDEGGTGKPSLYHVSSGLSGMNSQPSRGIARFICTCRANCDGSNVAPYLTANDFQCFINKFAAGDAFANCDGSTGTPVLTANDFQCFINSYAAGCP